MSAPGRLRAGSSSLDQTVDVETPEQTVLSYTIAGVGSRAYAALVDYLICILILLVLFLLVGTVLGATGAGKAIPGDLDAWLLAIMTIGQFAVIWGYYVLFEGLRDGQTPGKKRLGLRVVQDGGYSVGFAASAVRNLVRVLDMQPVVSYGLGLGSVALSRTGKRIGDMVAGTLVVQERPITIGLGGTPAAAVSEDTPRIAVLDDDEFALLSRFADRRRELDDARRSALVEQLATRFRSRAQDIEGGDAAFLMRLLERERQVRASGAAARSDTGAAREQYAIVAQGSPRWTEFSALLERARVIGIERLSEEEAGRFVSLYRDLSADLARLRTAARGRDFGPLFSLGRLVAGGHNLLYRQRNLRPGGIARFLGATVPREIRRSSGYIGLAAALLFGPLMISYAAVVRNPAVIPDLVPAQMIARAEQGVERAKNGEGYIDDPQLYRPVMSTSIMANNIQVSFFAFAFGATLGIGTMLLLVSNGISIGAVLGLYHSKGILPLILAFVAPHSAFELSAICIAGGAGLLLAAAIILPGNRTRREALVINGRRAIRLVAGATLLLIFAGALEGFVSPIEWWPIEWKASVGALCAIALYMYLRIGGEASEQDAPREEFAYDQPTAGMLEVAGA